MQHKEGREKKRGGEEKSKLNVHENDGLKQKAKILHFKIFQKK